MAPPRLADLLRQGTQALRKAGIPGAERDARLLLADAAGIAADRLTLHLPDCADEAAQHVFPLHIGARITRKPVSKILGRRAFWGREFRVTADVLDPRPETETLVVQALAGRYSSILDLGTGSGILAVSLLADRPGARGTATDISPAALKVARDNATRHDVIGRLDLTRADWFDGITGRFDLIVSNPPYIAEDEMAGLAPEVRDHDPALALTPGGDGLQPYRVIAAGAASHLTPGGRLLVEIGWQQGDAVAAIFRAHGLDAVAIHHDMDGRPRVVSGRAE